MAGTVHTAGKHQEISEMINFCFDKVTDRQRPYPNCALHHAEPYTQSWHEFDLHYPRTVPLRLLMYLDHAGIAYQVSSTVDNNQQCWYPIAFSWFDFDCDYLSFVPEQTLNRIRSGQFKILFYYHEGDNPIRIQQRIDDLLWQYQIPKTNYIFVSANSRARGLKQCVYFSDHEYFFRYVNRTQSITDPTSVPTYDFTALSRVHKSWRALCMSDLKANGLLNNSLWSYHTSQSIKETEHDNPIEIDHKPNWRQQVQQFMQSAPYHCDHYDSAQQNNHHLVNTDLYTASYFHIVFETHLDADQSNGTFLTEKTWKCIKYGQPFIIIGTMGSLHELRQSGFRTFDGFFPNGYDNTVNNTERYLRVRSTIEWILNKGISAVWQDCQKDVRFNQTLYQETHGLSLKFLLRHL